MADDNRVPARLRDLVVAAGLEGDTEGLGAVGAYKALSSYTQLGGVLTVFALPD